MIDKRRAMTAIVAMALVCGAVSLCMSGCSFGQRLNRARAAFVADNPGAKTIPVDEDGDGITDFLGQDKNADDVVDTDSTGKPLEVPDSRPALDEAETADLGIAELITLAGLAFGIPTGGLSFWWGRRKPIKQLTTFAVGLEKAKQNGAPEGFITVSKELLELYLKESPGLADTLDKMRAAAKAERKTK